MIRCFGLGDIAEYTEDGWKICEVDAVTWLGIRVRTLHEGRIYVTQSIA